MKSRSWFVTLVLLTTALMGSSFAIAKIALDYVSPFLLLGIRFTLAGFLMALFTKHLPRPRTLRDWMRILLIGLFQTVGVMGSIFLSLRTITASESSILTFVNPLLVVIFATIFMRAHYRLVQWGGVILGFLGVFLTLGLHLHLHVGTWLGLLGAVFWAVATLMIKQWRHRFNIWVLTAYQMLFGGIILLIGGLFIERPVFIVDKTSIFIVLWLAVMASIVQFSIWFYLLQHGDPGKTSAFLFLAPFFGVLSGWILLGEPITWQVFVGGIFIFAGIFLVNWPEPVHVKTTVNRTQ